ncbi:MAG: hypothetical protein LBQ24_02120 [Candidatus Peribacteria bacterium]|nr:hypothetical protein [Candidatus Peribacteria bacterium]
MYHSSEFSVSQFAGIYGIHKSYIGHQFSSISSSSSAIHHINKLGLSKGSIS